MTINHDTDPILRSVRQLQVLAPDGGRAERLRARCRARLKHPGRVKDRRLGPALIAALCVLYFSAIVHDVLRLRERL